MDKCCSYKWMRCHYANYYLKVIINKLRFHDSEIIYILTSIFWAYFILPTIMIDLPIFIHMMIQFTHIPTMLGYLVCLTHIFINLLCNLIISVDLLQTLFILYMKLRFIHEGKKSKMRFLLFLSDIVCKTKLHYTKLLLHMFNIYYQITKRQKRDNVFT